MTRINKAVFKNPRAHALFKTTAFIKIAAQTYMKQAIGAIVLFDTAQHSTAPYQTILLDPINDYLENACYNLFITNTVLMLPWQSGKLVIASV